MAIDRKVVAKKDCESRHIAATRKLTLYYADLAERLWPLARSPSWVDVVRCLPATQVVIAIMCLKNGLEGTQYFAPGKACDFIRTSDKEQLQPGVLPKFPHYRRSMSRISASFFHLLTTCILIVTRMCLETVCFGPIRSTAGRDYSALPNCWCNKD